MTTSSPNRTGARTQARTDPPQRLVEQALDLSTADGCVVLVEEADRANLRWASNTLTTNGATHGRRVTVVATVAGRNGVAAGVLSRTGVDAGTMADLVQAAESMARDGSPSEDAQPLLGGGERPGWADEPAATSIDVFRDLSPALGAAFGSARDAGHLLFGYAEHEVRTTYLGTSSGLRLRHAQPTGSVLLNGKSPDFVRSAFTTRATNDFTDVDMGALAAEVSQRLDWGKRRIDLPAGRYETLLPPDAVADLMAYAHWAGASARDAVEGRSVYSRPGGGTRLGDQLCGDAPVRVTLRSDPAAPGLACAPVALAHASGSMESVFDNGLPLAPTEWIRDGVLTTLITTRHTAGITGLPVAPPIDNLIMRAAPDGSGPSMSEMVAQTERGLLLTCLWYIRMVDPQSLLMTGLTRDGVYLIEDGEVTGEVNNFRFNESPIGLLHRIDEAGSTVRCLGREFGEYFNRTAMPALRIGDFNMSSVSRAS